MSGKALGIAAVAMLAGGVLGYAARGGPAAAQEPAGRWQVEAFVTGQIGASVA